MRKRLRAEERASKAAEREADMAARAAARIVARDAAREVARQAKEAAREVKRASRPYLQPGSAHVAAALSPAPIDANSMAASGGGIPAHGRESDGDGGGGGDVFDLCEYGEEYAYDGRAISEEKASDGRDSDMLAAVAAAAVAREMEMQARVKAARRRMEQQTGASSPAAGGGAAAKASPVARHSYPSPPGGAVAGGEARANGGTDDTVSSRAGQPNRGPAVAQRPSTAKPPAKPPAKPAAKPAGKPPAAAGRKRPTGGSATAQAGGAGRRPGGDAEGSGGSSALPRAKKQRSAELEAAGETQLMAMEGSEIDLTLWSGASAAGWRIIERRPGSWQLGQWTYVSPEGEPLRSVEAARSYAAGETAASRSEARRRQLKAVLTPTQRESEDVASAPAAPEASPKSTAEGSAAGGECSGEGSGGGGLEEGGLEEDEVVTLDASIVITG